MGVRLFVETPLAAGQELDLPAAAARHAQVRRVQPGEVLTLFDGRGHDWNAQVLAMGRSAVRVCIGTATAVHCELPQRVTLALGMPANERMDALVEKAAELGAAGVQPLLAERSVLRLGGERAERRREHWQAVAVSACEQCRRACVPEVAAVQALESWLARSAVSSPAAARWLLSLDADAWPLPMACAAAAGAQEIVLLSGPEGGFTVAEQQAAQRFGFVPVSLGPRVLRADTAPLAALAWIALASTSRKSGSD